MSYTILSKYFSKPISILFTLLKLLINQRCLFLPPMLYCSKPTIVYNLWQDPLENFKPYVFTSSASRKFSTGSTTYLFISLTILFLSATIALLHSHSNTKIAVERNHSLTISWHTMYSDFHRTLTFVSIVKITQSNIS